MLVSSSSEYSLLPPPDAKRGVNWQRMPAVLLVVTCLFCLMCASWIFIPHMVQVENPGKVIEKTNVYAHMSSMSRMQNVSKIDLKASTSWIQPPPLGYITNVISKPAVADNCDLRVAPPGALGKDDIMVLITGIKWHPVEQTLYYAGMNMIKKLDPETGEIILLAGRGGTCPGWATSYCGLNPFNWYDCALPKDGGDAFDAHFTGAHGVEWNFDTGGLYIVDAWHHAIRYVDPETNIITSVVGQAGIQGFGGDGGPATKAMLNYPHGCSRDQTTGDLYIPDMNNMAIRKVDGKTGVISTIWYAEGAQPCRIQIVPRTHPGNDLYVADSAGFVYKVDSITGSTVILAGKQQDPNVYVPAESNGDGGLATDANVGGPSGAQYDVATGDLYISDYTYSVIRKVDGKTGIITTIAGQWGVRRESPLFPKHPKFGDDGPAKDAILGGAGDIRWVPERRWLFVADLDVGAARLLQL